MTFEEGTWSAWLYDLLNPHVDKLVVCNPRKNALLKDGNKSDRIDARKLAELLRGNQLKPVYHGETGVRMLRELSRSYLTIVKDLSRVMNRLKAVYRSWAIPCAGRDVYYTAESSSVAGQDQAITLKTAIGSESTVRVVCASLAGAAPELLLLFSACKAQLLDCRCHAVTSILRIVFQKIIRLER